MADQKEDERRAQRLIGYRQFRVYRFTPDVLLMLTQDRRISSFHRDDAPCPADALIVGTCLDVEHVCVLLIVVHESFPPQASSDPQTIKSPKMSLSVSPPGAIKSEPTGSEDVPPGTTKQSLETPGVDLDGDDPFGLFKDTPFQN